MTQNILPFHKRDMEILGLLKKKRTEARIAFVIGMLLGLMLGTIWVDWRNRNEMDRMQRAYTAEEERP
jgi:hypothetical protein